MNLKVKTEGVNYYIDNKVNVFDFGDLKKGSPAIVDFVIEGNNITEANLVKTCGCTLTAIENNASTIQYKDTHIINQFSKIIKFSYKENGILNNEQIRIKGNIIN